MTFTPEKIEAWVDEFGELHRSSEQAAEVSTRKALAKAIDEFFVGAHAQQAPHNNAFDTMTELLLREFLSSWQATGHLEALAAASLRRHLTRGQTR